MPEQDRFGRDLLIAVRGAGPLRAQIEDQVREDVRAGRLRPGEPLPGTRSLAAELGISRGVVVEAYAQLVAEGYLVTRPGGATVVASGLPVATGAQGGGAAPATPAIRWDFRPQSADLGAFPRRAWLAAARRVLGGAPDAALDYGDRAGDPGLREVLAGYLGRARGVAAEPGRIVITSGMTQAVSLVGRVLAARGTATIAVEDPGFALHHGVLRAAGLRTVPVAVDDDGLRVDALAASGAGAVLVTPAHQMPTGAVLSPERRAALLDWGGLILEDDYDGEFRYDRAAVGALQGLAPDHVAHLGSTSKTLAPGLRLGWAVLPADLVEPVVEQKLLDDGGTPVIEQLVLADLIERGELDRHVRRMRARYRRRRDAMVAGVGELLPELELHGIAAGLHVMATLPAGTDLDALLGRTWGAGLAIVGFPHGGREHVVLGWGNAAEPAIRAGLRELRAALL